MWFNIFSFCRKGFFSLKMISSAENKLIEERLLSFFCDATFIWLKANVHNCLAVESCQFWSGESNQEDDCEWHIVEERCCGSNNQKF